MILSSNLNNIHAFFCKYLEVSIYSLIYSLLSITYVMCTL